MAQMESEVLEQAGLKLDTAGMVATITLNRPSTRNSQTPATWLALRAIGASLDPGVRVVVVRGEGEFVNGPTRHRFGPGDLLFVPAGVVHRFEDVMCRD